MSRKSKNRSRQPDRSVGQRDPDDEKLVARADRSKRDDDDAHETARVSRRRGPLDEREEAEVAEEDILEELDVSELR